MTKEQRKKIIDYLINPPHPLPKEVVEKYNANAEYFYLTEDLVPISRIDGSCASINERLVDPMLLQMFIEAATQPLREMRPSRRYMPEPDGLPILNTSTRQYFVRMLHGISNRLFQLPYMGEAFVFDGEYLIQGSGAVCGWDSKEEKQ